MNLTPKVSVLMPVFNCERYVRGAVDSILNQTFGNFELIVIDDASPDETISILKKYNDPRIRLIEKPVNTGYTESLNLGLSLARGQYLARMDGDDISLPERLFNQVAFMDSNSDVVLCGTSYKIIGGEDSMIRPPQTDAEIKLALLRGNCIAHPTVMLRKKVLDQNFLFYDPSKEPAEDYDLWARLIPLGKLHNLQEVLLDYRLHYASVSRKRYEEQIRSTVATKLELMEFLNVKFQPDEERVLKKVFQKFETIELEDIEIFQKIKKKLAESNRDKFFEPQGFLQYLLELEDEVVKKFVFRYTRYSPSVFLNYLKFRKLGNFKMTKFDEAKLLFKSFLFWKI